MSAKTFLSFLFVSFSLCSFSQQASIDSGSLLLHKFEQKIGKEKYTVTSNGQGVQYTIAFKFTDRGRDVALQSTYHAGKSGEPERFRIKGSTSRFSTIDDSIVIRDRKAYLKTNDSASTLALKGPAFPIGGYAPGAIQMLLIQYWENHQRPKVIQALPSGMLSVTKDGQDTLTFNGQPLVLKRYVITGLIWGNELVWTDTKGKLICLITNDAEGDKVEMMNEPHESLLAQIIDKAGIYGMRLFTHTAGSLPVNHPVIAITGARLVNVQDGSVSNNTTVLIRDGKISSIGPDNKVTIPKSAYLIPAKGKTLLPGLWDMHAHFEQAEWGPAYLAAGVTTVRDCGGEFGYINTVKQVIDEQKGVGPHILKAGFIDGKGPVAAGIIQVSTKEEAIREVRRYKEAGFVQMKIYSSVKPDMVKVICDEAHRLGMTVTGHIPRGMTLQQGVDSGMDMVNHIQYVFRMMKVDTVNYTINFDDSASQAALTYIKSHKVVIDPTLVVYELSGRALSDNIRDIEPAFNTIPLPLQTLFLNTGVSDSADILFYKAFLKGNQQIVKRLSDLGVPLVAGTDMGMPGFSLFRELELYVGAGLTPLQALRSTTIVPAQVMKLDQQTGSLEVGKAADLILVDGNPLEDIKKIRNVKLVMKNGRVYDPATMHQLAGFSK